MRYWGTESKVSQGGRRNADNVRATRRKPTTTTKSKSKVATGGSVQPFLRKVYTHPAVASRPMQRILLLLALAGILYAFVLGDAGVIRIAVLRHQRAAADRDIAELRDNVALLQQEIGRLQNDAFYIEKIARERYGYVKPGDQVFKIVPKPKEK